MATDDDFWELAARDRAGRASVASTAGPVAGSASRDREQPPRRTAPERPAAAGETSRQRRRREAAARLTPAEPLDVEPERPSRLPSRRAIIAGACVICAATLVLTIATSASEPNATPKPHATTIDAAAADRFALDALTHELGEQVAVAARTAVAAAMIEAIDAERLQRQRAAARQRAKARSHKRRSTRRAEPARAPQPKLQVPSPASDGNPVPRPAPQRSAPSTSQSVAGQEFGID